MELPVPMWSVEWLMSVVVVGVGVHLLAAYLKPRLDRMGAWTSRGWATRSEKRTRARLTRIDDLRRNEATRLAAAFRELRWHFRSVQCMLFAVLIMMMFFAAVTFVVTVASVGGPVRVIVGVFVAVCGVLALLILLLALSAIVEATSIEAELTEAMKSKGKEAPTS